MGFALADYRLEGLCDHSILCQNSGEKRQVLVPHGLLQGDAGGGNEDRLGEVQAMENRCGNEISVGLSNASPGVAEGDAAVLHGLQHPVAQGNLLQALRHPLSRK